MYSTVTLLIVASVYASGSPIGNEVALEQPKISGIAYLIPLFQPIHQEDNEILNNRGGQETDGNLSNTSLYALLVPLASTKEQNLQLQFENMPNQPMKLKEEVVSIRQKRSPARPWNKHSSSSHGGHYGSHWGSHSSHSSGGGGGRGHGGNWKGGSRRHGK